MRRILVFLGGQSSLGKENSPEWAPPSTLPSFERALGSDIDLEIDLRISKDGEIVVFHDPIVDRRTDGAGCVIDKTLRELKQLDAGTWLHPKFKGLKILTFEEFLELAGKYDENIIDVHLKETMDGYEGKVVKMVEDCGMVDRVQFHVNNEGADSLSPGILKRIKNINAKLVVGTNVGRSSRSQIMQLIDSVPYIDYIWTAETKESFWIDRELVSGVHDRQKKVIVGAKPSTFERCKELIDIGVDGINAESPLDIRRYLNQRD